MMSSMDKITMLLHSNHKNGTFHLNAGTDWTGGSDVKSWRNTLSNTQSLCCCVENSEYEAKDKQEALKQQQKRSNATQTSQQSSQLPHF